MALIDYLGKHSFQAADPEGLSGKQGEGVDAYVDVCSRCHALPDPKAHTAEEWTTVVDRMANNMMNLGMEPMSSEQKKGIYSYLQNQARN